MENYFQPRLSRGAILDISSIGLAHMGDAVFELLVRSWLCAHGGATGRGMHRAAVALGGTPRSTPFPTTPAGPSTARPRLWRRCWAGSTSKESWNGSTNSFAG